MSRPCVSSRGKQKCLGIDEEEGALLGDDNERLTLARKDIVLAFGRQVGRALVFFLGILDCVGDIGQERVRVGELENVGRDDGVVVP